MLKRHFYKMFYYFVSLFFRLFIKYKAPKSFDNIMIFGKGESLNYYLSNFYIKRKNIDLLILINFEKNDLKSFNLKNLIENIPIIILGNVTEPLLNFDNIINLNLYKVFVQRFYPNKNNIKSKKGLAMLRQSYKLNSYSLKVNYLNDYIKEFLRQNNKIKKSSNCGLIGLILACSYKPVDIFIFGIDFYESQYFNKKLIDNMDLKEKNKLISLKENFKIMFELIIKKHKKINFKLFTKAKLKKKYKNLQIHKV